MQAVAAWSGFMAEMQTPSAGADQTHKRSITTQPITIQPPPLPAINGVAGSGSYIPQEPSSA
jgi:hypothetical protein